MFGWGKKKTGRLDFSRLGVDMHSHLVPGIDDGSPDMETSLQLVRGLSELGYRKLITTPHILWDMYKNSREMILEKFEDLRQAVQREGIPVEMEVAAEYFVDDHLQTLLADKVPLLTIGDKMVLVEFSLANQPLDLGEILFEMQLQGYQPLIAHPERYIYPMGGKRFFEELKAAGYLFQLNILSLAGAYGKEVQKQANYLLSNGYYQYAGTDLHHFRHLDALHSPSLGSHLHSHLEKGIFLNQDL